MKKYLKLMRVHHWIKNFLVLLPVIFNRSFFHVKHLEEVGWGFVSISFIASVVYIFNDIKDCEKDKLHPTKKNRPIASGCSYCTPSDGFGNTFIYYCNRYKWLFLVVGWNLLAIIIFWIKCRI